MPTSGSARRRRLPGDRKPFDTAALLKAMHAAMDAAQTAACD
jgi:hypothetical protein